jgi:predicted ArsR family transcriptional regulator
MAFRQTEIGALITTDPARARVEILEAFARADGFQNRAAEQIGVSVVTLIRWIAKLDMRADVERTRTEAKAKGRFDLRGRGATGRPRSVT